MPHRVRSVFAARGGHTHYQPTLHDAIDLYYRITKFEKCSMSDPFATDSSQWYMLQ